MNYGDRIPVPRSKALKTKCLRYGHMTCQAAACLVDILGKLSDEIKYIPGLSIDA